MTKFLILFRAPVPAMEQMKAASAEQTQAGMDAWMAWTRNAGNAIADLGAPLVHATTLGDQSDKAGSDIVGFSILQGESSAAVRNLMEAHPHLRMPGFAIEVLEALPMPGSGSS